MAGFYRNATKCTAIVFGTSNMALFLDLMKVKEWRIFVMFDQGLLSSCDCNHDTILDRSDIAVTREFKI